MQRLLIAIGLLVCFDGFCQKYQVGLVKTGATIKNVEGQIVVTDSTVTSIFDGKSSTLKVTGRSGYTIHVTNGTSVSKYVIGHHTGRQHGFTFDSSITYHPPAHHPGVPVSVFYCLIKRD